MALPCANKARQAKPARLPLAPLLRTVQCHLRNRSSAASPTCTAAIFPSRSMRNVVGRASTPPKACATRVVAQHDPVVHRHAADEGLDHVPALLVHGDPDHREAPVLVLALEIDEPRDLDLARPAPGGPEVQQHHLAPVVGEPHGLAVGVLEGEVRRGLALAVRFTLSAWTGLEAEQPRAQVRSSGAKGQAEAGMNFITSYDYIEIRPADTGIGEPAPPRARGSAPPA